MSETDIQHGWIVVRNWERFQHPDTLRGEGIPPWFRVYTKLVHNPDFAGLTELERGLLLTIWVEFCASDGQLTVRSLSKCCHGRVRTRSLDALIHAGFIQVVASRPLASRKQHASLEERREEKKDLKGFAEEKTQAPNGKVYQCDHCPGGMKFKSQARLDEHLHVVHDLEPAA